MVKRITNITDDDIESVCKILDGWPMGGKLTWDGLVQAVEQRHVKKWSRQSLEKHTRIKQAYKLKKKTMSTARPAVDKELPADLRKALESIDRLESENKRLAKENNDFYEQFRRWSFNADAKGLSLAVLDQPVSTISKGRTRRLGQ